MENSADNVEGVSTDSEEYLAAGSQPFCFVTRQSNYKTIRGESRDDAQQKGNRNVIYGPVQFCHDGACVHEGESYPNSDESCDS